MFKRWAVLAGALALVVSGWAAAQPLPSAAPEEVGLSSARLARIGEVLQAGVDRGEIPGAVVLVARRGKVAYFEAFGDRDPEVGDPLGKDAIFRIYSMTKPITSVAAMMLVEEGRITLSDPVSKYLPDYAGLRVGVESFDPATGRTSFETVPAQRQVTVHDLLRHTSGFVYGIFGGTGVHRAYREADMDDLLIPQSEFDSRLAALPVVHQPGTTWEYGRSTDVLGRVIETVSGRRLGEFLEERIFGPLGMSDTAFQVPADRVGRIAEPIRGGDPDAPLGYLDVTQPAPMDAGGHGLASTASDYARFSQMLLGGGALDGVRLLSPKTVAYMASDHLGSLDRGPRFLPGPGYSFGLGFGVRTEDGVAPIPGSKGEFYWGGYAGTYFWIDPAEELLAVYMMQSISQRAHYRLLFKSLVMQSIIEPNGSGSM